MRHIDSVAIIAHDIGRIFEFLSIATLVPFLVLVFFREWDLLLPMASAPLVFFIFGYLLSRVQRPPLTPTFSISLITVALSWFAVALIGALPFFFGLSISYTDSLFEAMSGWTGTGFSMMTSLDTTPNTLLFWRSFTQWIGGIGIVAFGISLRRKTTLGLFQLYRSEGRSESLMPNVVSTGRRMWLIYLALTFFFTGLVMLSGIALWDSLNLVMVALATGGFTIHNAGLMYYNNPMLELLLIPVMLAGALPFKVYFLLYRGNIKGMFKDRIVQVLLLIAATGSAITSLDLFIFNNLTLEQAIRQGTFCAISGFTTTGLQNSNPHLWAPIPIAVVTLMMLIGGASGSTAGGIKVNRVMLAYAGVKWWLKRFFVSSHVLVPLRFEGRTIPLHISDLEISKNMVVIILYIFTIFVSTIIVMHLYITSFEINQIIFEEVSAISNVGLSLGYITAASPFAIKWIFIFLMWLGRLEISPAIILIISVFKGIEDKIMIPKPTPRLYTLQVRY
ncbi:MAG: TrkH family potassium uptake protein [Methanoregula sp.]|jgi:trk system potassium uptake protein TrkH|nr:TrkH family potassium uptake protein [Methanoregula sp.]